MARYIYRNDYTALLICTVTEAKIHLRVDGTDEDNYITDLIKMAQNVIEDYCNISLFETDFTQYCDTWDETRTVLKNCAPHRPRFEFTSIKYYNDNDVLTTWAATNYDVNEAIIPVRISPKDDVHGDTAYPTLSSRQTPIELRYKAGYDNVGDVPIALKQAAYILIGQFYENRQINVVGRSVGEINVSAKYLMDRYKIQRV